MNKRETTSSPGVRAQSAIDHPQQPHKGMLFLLDAVPLLCPEDRVPSANHKSILPLLQEK